ncbi:MAG: cell division protein FtsQ/DivIB [Candidatus Omnitrophica bacterium]|nr:cell division protein FtsQ/DivIB [Candidatus Omnitrophota bacterium]
MGKATKKTKIKIPVNLIRNIVIIIVLFGLGFWISLSILDRIIQAPNFKVRKVVVEQSLDFIQRTDFSYMVGKSIFEVDLPRLKQGLELRYPQLANLRVTRRFPNEIVIAAQKRDPFLQFEYNRRLITLDHNGYILFYDQLRNEKLPLVKGVKVSGPNLTLGYKLRSDNAFLAVEIFRALEAEPKLKGLIISTMDISNMSKVEVALNNGLLLYLSKDKMKEKMGMLAIVMQQPNFQPETIEYIDLRFNEPVLKAKPEVKSKVKGQRPKDKG